MTGVACFLSPNCSPSVSKAGLGTDLKAGDVSSSGSDFTKLSGPKERGTLETSLHYSFSYSFEFLRNILSYASVDRIGQYICVITHFKE